MQKVTKTIEKEFSAISIQDAIEMAPLMDGIIDTLNNCKDGLMVTCIPVCMPRQSMENIFRMLAELGFCGTGTVDLMPTSDEA